MSKFKVGDKVICNNPYLWGKSRYRTVWGYHTCRNTDCYNHPVGTELLILSEGENGRPITTGWTDEDLELYVEEFTFEEVIARIKKGEVYRGTGGSTVDEITKKNTEIRISICRPQTGIVPTMQKYKLVPQKNNYLLFEVEHQEGGKRYLFRSDCNYNLGDIVICQTSLGKSYGKIVYKVIKELTEEEFKAYKPIIKSV